MAIVTDYLEKTAEQFGGKIVIRDPSREISYSELVDIAKNIGYNINKVLSSRRDVPITVFIDKGCECLSAIFGIIYSGNCYVPMDIKTPKERFESIIETMESDIVICTEKTAQLIEKDHIKCRILFYEALVQETIAEGERDIIIEKIRNGIIDTDLLYILFTSGSTGVPKGVAVTHRSVDDYIHAFMQVVPIGSDDIVGNQVPFYVDMSLKDIYMSITAGATIVVIPQTYFMSPKKLLRYLDDNNITMLMWVPTAYSIVSRFDGLSHIRPERIQKFIFSGESMPISVFNYWKQKYPSALWIQLYGPTEITGACTIYSADRLYEEGETIPIGKPLPNTGIMLLSDDNIEIKRDNCKEDGEICVYGSCLAAGYYNDLIKTEKSFVQNPLIKTHHSLIYRTGDIAKWDEQGNLVFISRKDHQIKHGGRRIELGEIEAAADSVDGVLYSCCVHEPSVDAIVLFYEGAITESELKEKLKMKLPAYMIPSKNICMKMLPVLPNGKLNRKEMALMASGYFK